MKKTCSLLLLLAAALTASALTEEKIHETRAAKAGGKLIVDVDFGSINVAPGDGDKVVVDAYRKIEASSKEKEEEYFKAVPVSVTNEGDTVAVRAVRKHESLGAQLWNLMRHTTTEARYTIRVPASFSIDVDTAGGEISASGLTGTVKADTSGGELSFSSIHGDLNAETSGGDITSTGCDGVINLETSGGRIEVTDGRGKLQLETAGGAVTVKNFAGDAKIESSGGRIRLANISGKLHAETSGGAINAILPPTVTDDVRLETSAGAITVVAPPTAALTVDARTSAGGVSTDLPMSTMKADHDSLQGTINGGGKSIVLRTSAGSIRIVSADKETAQQ